MDTIDRLYSELERISSNMLALAAVLKLELSKEAKDELTKAYEVMHGELSYISQRIDTETFGRN